MNHYPPPDPSKKKPSPTLLHEKEEAEDDDEEIVHISAARADDPIALFARFEREAAAMRAGIAREMQAGAAEPQVWRLAADVRALETRASEETAWILHELRRLTQAVDALRMSVDALRAAPGP
jgi:hypothetical protein